MSMRSFAKVLPRLRDARDGGVSVLFGLALIPVVGAVGLAIDYGASVRIRSMLKASTDAAALAGVNAITNGGDPSAIATSFMNAKLAGTGLTPTVNVTVNTGSATVQVAATLAHGNSFMGALGISTTNIAVHSTASAGAGGGPVEVAISFDTTGSMAGSKMTAAQDAAQQLVETLFAVPGSTSQNSNVSVGLVPFSSYVNVGTAYRGASWLTNSTDYSETKYECWDTYPNATYTNPVPRSGTCYNDGLPYTCTWTDYTVNYGTAVNVCANNTYNYTWNGCVGSQQSSYDALDGATSSNKVPALMNYYCPAPLLRLTKKKNDLKKAINDMSASGETYIAPGLLWGWRVLTPNAASPFADGAAYGTAKKIMIVLTDGANTHSANYGAGDHEAGDVAAANAKLLETCQNIKATGIQLFTIAFEVSDSAIQNVLSQCSSGPPYYYNATTVADLQGAFTSIGNQLTAPRITE